MNKAIFLDRDGTINFDSGYLSSPSQLQLLDGVVEALKVWQERGYLLVIITNQSGIGRGFFTLKEAEKVNESLVEMLGKEGVQIDKIMLCPHSPEQDCACRKPNPFMINSAAEELNIDKEKSFMFGDKDSDVECGIRAGVKSFLITERQNLQYWAEKIEF